MNYTFKEYIEEHLAKKISNSIEWEEIQKRFRANLEKIEAKEINDFFQAMNDLMAHQNYISYTEGFTDGLTLHNYHIRND